MIAFVVLLSGSVVDTMFSYVAEVDPVCAIELYAANDLVESDH